MAITATHHDLFRRLPISRGSSLLEIGEANWYGDLDPQSVGLTRRESLFDVAKEFYESWISPGWIVSVDMNGTENALRHDLNSPFDLGERFGVVINHGTAEHVFNIGQVFRTIHNHCEVDGWMIHDAPFTGWINHGFYCLHPTLFYDIAAANCYEVVLVAIHEAKSLAIVRMDSRDHVLRVAEHIPNNSLLFAAFRKRVDQPFAVPMQCHYTHGASVAARKAWETMR